MMSDWQIDPLPCPSVERRDGLLATRGASRSSLDLVQDRFPNDHLHLDDMVSGDSVS